MKNINKVYVEARSLANKDKKLKLQALANNPDTPTFANTILELENILWLHLYPDGYFEEALDNIQNPKEVSFWSKEREDAFKTDSELKEDIEDFSIELKIYHRILKIMESENLSSEDSKRLLTKYYFYYKNKYGSINHYSENYEENVEHYTLIEKLKNNIDANGSMFNHFVDKSKKDILNITEEDMEEFLPFFDEHSLDKAKEYTQKYNNLESGQYRKVNVDSYSFPISRAYNFLMTNESPKLRELMFKKKTICDNYGIMKKLMIHKARYAETLGYKNYSEYKLSDQILNSPEKVLDFLLPLWQKLRIQFIKQLDLIKNEYHLSEIYPHDLLHYRHKYIKQKFSVNQSEISNYLTYDNVLNGCFDIIKKVFNVDIHKSSKRDVFNEEYECFILSKNNKELGTLFMNVNPDADCCCETNRFSSCIDNIEVLPIATVHLGIDENENLSVSDVHTIFHEMGHALHVFLSEARYPSQSGSNTCVDFVELPSLLFEKWCLEPDVLKIFAENSQGKKMPLKLMKDYISLVHFNEIFNHSLNILLDIQDIKIHSLTLDEAHNINWDTFEQNIWKSLDVPKCLQIEGAMTKDTHIFGNGLYGSQSYSYLYDRILAADIFSKIKESGIFDEKICTKLVKDIYSRGSSRDPMDCFKAFMGRDLDFNPFLKQIEDNPLNEQKKKNKGLKLKV
jgi:peptidyl-dipeptidase Dcp